MLKNMCHKIIQVWTRFLNIHKNSLGGKNKKVETQTHKKLLVKLCNLNKHVNKTWCDFNHVKATVEVKVIGKTCKETEEKI